MLFSSYPFIFGFLPLALLLFYGAARLGRMPAMITLAALSLGFYAYWRVEDLWVLLFSITFNYLLGGQIQRDRRAERFTRMRWLLRFGVTVDLAMLIYFKYTGFIIENIDMAAGTNWTLGHIILPLGISFFTFQKIAYLADSARGEADKTGFIEFGLFASFFPQLIAGPISHYKEIIPQFSARLFGTPLAKNLLVGTVMFAIGLFKKVIIADSIANYLNPLYTAAAANHGGIDFFTGWTIAISYTLQLYFDFSGYSDMAIGLARMFGVRLPINFHSPLRAASIIDYWRRWHMTLQRFIVTYVFTPLSVPFNRFAIERGLTGWPAFGFAVAIPSFLTFFVMGVWHGAGWGFVVYGLLNAIYVSVNEAWRERRKRRRRALRKLKQTLPEPGLAERVFYHVLTLACVFVGNMFFRALTFGDGAAIFQGMFGLHGFDQPALFAGMTPPLLFVEAALAAVIVALFPNTQQIMARFRPAVNWRLWKTEAPALLRWRWRPTAGGIAFAGVALFFGVAVIQRGQAIFLYFNF
jgi:D-alanyl-lipoteichoic acid acyltransferase DltB (MBOAT superfamily)